MGKSVSDQRIDALLDFHAPLGSLAQPHKLQLRVFLSLDYPVSVYPSLFLDIVDLVSQEIDLPKDEPQRAEDNHLGDYLSDDVAEPSIVFADYPSMQAAD